MFRKGLVLVGTLFCLAIFVEKASAQLPQIYTGLSFLASTQSPIGNWDGENSLVETTVATTSVLATLKLLNQSSGSNFASGASWLDSQELFSVHQISERILALGPTEASADGLLPALDPYRGGWGGYNGYAVNTLDTALALQALQTIDTGEFSITNTSLAFLIGNQNPDGGWGFFAGSDSTVYLTATVSSTLQQFPQTSSIAGAIQKASLYLVSHQNPDGGFGSSPSTAYETGLAYAALVAVYSDAAVLGNAVNYLIGTQAANGSWDEDPYSTALALTALHLSENQPSPPPPPPAGGTITGTLVDATTNQRLASVSVVLDSDQLINTSSDASGNFSLRDVPAGSQKLNFSLGGYQSSSALAEVTINATLDLGIVSLVSAYSTGTIAGTISDPSGKPLPGVTITVDGAWSGTATTGTDGSYKFTYVTPGDVTVAASKAGFQDVTSTGTVYARTTLSFSPRMGPDIPQDTTGILVGRVIDSYWGLPIDHLPGEQGVTVTLTGGITAKPDPDNRGLFEISGLAPGTYQVTVGMNGFTSQTFRVVIVPGVTTDLGTIRLKMTISKMTLTGQVTDAISGEPIPGAEITIAGTLLTGRSDFGGTYAIDDIDHPADITVRTSALGYTGKAFLIRTSPFLQTMNVALTPRSDNDPPTGTEVDVRLQTDQASYTKSEPVEITANLWNKVGQDYATTLKVQITDPDGSMVYETTQEVSLPANLTMFRNVSWVLPLSASGGTYRITAQVQDANGLLLGMGTQTFGVSTSKVTISPQLPAALIEGNNEIAFQLENIGIYPVSGGLLDVTLTDPDGEVVYTNSQNFTLELGERKDLPLTITIPGLRFGAYTLTYTQSDETLQKEPVEISLPNTWKAVALFDDNSHRIRSTAGLTVTFTNDGRFNLVSGGAGVPVTVALPDADYEETKVLKSPPVSGHEQGSALSFSFPLPDSLSPGLHQATVSATLPSGSTLVQNATLAILESSLTMSPLQQDYLAGQVISATIANNGGVDTPVQYNLSLYDAKAVLIAEIAGTESAFAGDTLPLDLVIPVGAVEGSYKVVSTFKDLKTGQEQSLPTPLTITGVKGTLQVKTDKEEYLSTEEITALSSLKNTGTDLQDGNLHLKVVTTAGTREQKTWTSKEDFQQGVRSGVDTYGVNDWMVPYDDFESSALNGIWNPNGNVTIQAGKLFVDASTASAGVSSKFELEGDFDVQIEFFENNSRDNGVTFSVGGGNFNFSLNNTIGSGYGCDLRINGAQVSWNRTGSYSASGRFRITRIADVITGYYWNGSSWIEIKKGQYPEFTSPAHIEMSIWRGPGYLGPNTTKYDNFNVVSGRVQTVNQTVDSVRLLPLNDNFDDGIFNIDRWNLSGTTENSELSGGLHLASSDDSPLQRLSAKVPLTGNFSAVSIYKNYSCIPSGIRQGRYVMSADAGGSGYYIQRTSYDLSRGGGEFLVSLSHINNQNWQMTNDIPHESDSGRFRLRRDGTIGSTDYWDGEKWVNQHSRSEIPTSSAALSMYVYSQLEMPA